MVAAGQTNIAARVFGVRCLVSALVFGDLSPLPVMEYETRIDRNLLRA